MPNRILLLTGETEGPFLTDFLLQHAPNLRVDVACHRAALEEAFSGDVSGLRLIAVLTNVLVPGRLLAQLDGPAYNIHPGPPEYSGSCAAGFAIYDGATSFGVTLHEMAAKVDSGAIVEVRRFSLRPEPLLDATQLEIESFKKIIELFKDHARHFATNDAALALSGEVWSGCKHTIAEAEGLKHIPPHSPEDEINRRRRAFGC